MTRGKESQVESSYILEADCETLFSREISDREAENEIAIYGMATTRPEFKFGSKLQNKRVLVLGGTSGIGFSVAEACKALGAIVSISSSSNAKISNAISRLKRDDDTQRSICAHACNLDSLNELETNLRQLFEVVTEQGKQKLDHIVYTAGNKAGSVGLLDIKVETVTEHGILRFYAPIMIGKLASTYMNNSHQSSITLTSGVNNVKPVPGRVLMAGWGAGVEGITRALAVDLKPIRINCVCPGPTQTELFGMIPQEILEPLLEKYRKSLLTNEVGTLSDVAEAYLYCMKNYFVDGTVIRSDGGLLLG